MLSPPSPGRVPMPPPAAHPQTLGSSAVAMAGAQNAAQAAKAEGMGFDNTVLTSPEGVRDRTQTAKATLLGN